MRKIAICILLLMAGCGPIKVTVYGKSGAAYTAPDLCAAILSCQKAGETACMYDDVKSVDAQGDTSTNFCHVVSARDEVKK